MNKTQESRTLPTVGIIFLACLALLIATSKQPVNPPENWVEGWQRVNSFLLPRRALAATATEDFLYIIGGIDANNDYVLSVEYAPILADGRLGSWKQTRPIQKGRFYLAATNFQGYLYALGGGGGEIGSNNVPLASVERAKILPDGQLGPWQHHSYLTTPRRGLKTAIVDHFLYAIGGYNGSFLKSTERLDLNAAVPDWRPEQNQSLVDRYIHASATHKNRLFLLGGHVQKSGSMSYGDVESARISHIGDLGEWSIEPTRLTTARFIASAFSLSDYLYILGGHNGTNRLASVEMAKIDSNGNVGHWQPLMDLNDKRMLFTLIMSTLPVVWTIKES